MSSRRDSDREPRFFRRLVRDYRRRLRRLGAGDDAGAAGPSCVLEGLYPEALAQIYSSRDAFVSTAQSAFAVLLLFYTAASVLVASVLTADEALGIVQVFGICVLSFALVVIPAAVGVHWVRKAEAGYDLYVAAVLHALVVSRALRLPLSHHWLTLMEECLTARGRFESSETRYPQLRFVPSAIRTEPIMSARHAIAVWKSRRPNLLSFYETIFLRATRWVALAGLVVNGTIVTFALGWPTMLFPLDAPPSSMTTEGSAASAPSR